MAPPALAPVPVVPTKLVPVYLPALAKRKLMKTALTYLLQELGLSHRQLAILLGTTHSTISRYLSGLRSLPAEAEARLAVLYAAALQVAERKHDTKSLPLDASGQADRDYRLELEQTRQLRQQLRRQRQHLEYQLTQTGKMAQWLEQMNDHAHLLELPRQQRCLEELKREVLRRQKRLQPQIQEVNGLLWQSEQEISFLQHQLQLPFHQTGEH